MFKTFLSACAMVLISGGIAMAQDFNGVYAGQSQGQNITVTLRSEGDLVRGVVLYNGAELPLIGRNSNGRLQGTWRAPNGQDIPFVAATSDSSLELQTAGVTYSLSRGQVAPVGNDRPQTREQAAPAQANTDIQMEQGQYFTRPVPAGWTTSESANETFVANPDGSMLIGFGGLERYNTGTPIQFLQFMAVTVYKVQDFHVISAQRVPFDGGEAIEAIFTASANGRSYKYWARVAVVRAYGATSGYMLFVGSDPNKFEQVAGTLKTLAEKIQVTNATGAFGRDEALAVQRNSNFNHPMDHSFADQYWKNAKRMDDVFARGSDVRRDSYTSTDPSTGQRYYHGQAAWDPTRGGVVNPERPTELLKPADHWQNR